MLLRAATTFLNFQRKISALYVPGDKAMEYYAVLTPYFDFNKKLQNREKLNENIKLRKMSIDLNEVYQLWSVYSDIQTKKYNLENSRVEMTKLINELSSSCEDQSSIQNFKTKAIMIREDLKNLKDNSYRLEETFIHKFLSLPNDIHARTPIDTATIHYKHYIEPDKSECQNHLENTKYVEYHNQYCYYLRDAAAHCDLNLPIECLQFFKSRNFIPFSNPDFVRTIIPEGAAVDVNQLLQIADYEIGNNVNFLHLSGNGSMLSYLGHLTKLIVFDDLLPLKFISTGKMYLNQMKSSSNGLYSACQTTNVQLFAITSNETESQHQFDEILKEIIEFYKSLEIHFRVRFVTVDELHESESIRVDFEMFSSYQQCYISVGHLSCYNDYISKRLLISCKNKKFYIFSHLISGCVINVTRFIAILLENKDVSLIARQLSRSKS